MISICDGVLVPVTVIIVLVHVIFSIIFILIEQHVFEVCLI